jgi:pentatricopeptide repeat protein
METVMLHIPAGLDIDTYQLGWTCMAWKKLQQCSAMISVYEQVRRWELAVQLFKGVRKLRHTG